MKKNKKIHTYYLAFANGLYVKVKNGIQRGFITEKKILIKNKKRGL